MAAPTHLSEREQFHNLHNIALSIATSILVIFLHFHAHYYFVGRERDWLVDGDMLRFEMRLVDVNKFTKTM